ncbi:MAG: hypothetical protein OEY97_05110 [Nitrospirota bacterium]|nr:hypothetical protein [Nitrospirota bacterium]
MPIKHTRKRHHRPNFLTGGNLARDLRLEEHETGCTVHLHPTFVSVMAAMGTSLAVVTVLLAGFSLALLESRGPADPYFLVMMATLCVALARFTWIHMSRESIHVENGSLAHRRTLLGLGPHHRYPAECIGGLRLDRPTGGVVRFECQGRVARVGFGLTPDVSRCLLETLETQLARLGNPAPKG